MIFQASTQVPQRYMESSGGRGEEDSHDGHEHAPSRHDRRAMDGARGLLEIAQLLALVSKRDEQLANYFLYRILIIIYVSRNVIIFIVFFCT